MRVDVINVVGYLFAGVIIPIIVDVWACIGPKGFFVCCSAADFHVSASFFPTCKPRCIKPNPKLPADKDILNNVIVRDDFLVETSALSCGHPLIDSKRCVI